MLGSDSSEGLSWLVIQGMNRDMFSSSRERERIQGARGRRDEETRDEIIGEYMVVRCRERSSESRSGDARHAPTRSRWKPVLSLYAALETF